MNDLMERYLSAVCSYFMGPKRKVIYKDLKKQLQANAKNYGCNSIQVRNVESFKVDAICWVDRNGKQFNCCK